MNPKLINVRDDRNGWAEFFINEREPVSKRNGHLRYTATWVAYSSFGVFGHQWYDMGVPFAEFIQDVESDYLLSKIGRKVTSGNVACRSVRREVLRARKDRRVTADVAREAWSAIDGIQSEYSDEEIPRMLYDDEDVNEVPIDWMECKSQEWDTQVVMFVKKLWPLFVEKLKGEL